MLPNIESCNLHAKSPDICCHTAQCTWISTINTGVQLVQFTSTDMYEPDIIECMDHSETSIIPANENAGGGSASFCMSQNLKTMQLHGSCIFCPVFSNLLSPHMHVGICT